MAIYQYKCETCEQTVDVLQDHDKQHPPTKEEFPADCKEGGEHSWKKVFGKFTIAKSASWGPGKGHW